MPKQETHAARITRLETAMADLAEKMNLLLDMQARHEVRLDGHDDQFAALKAEEIERGRQLDERIAALVSAIGALITKMDQRA